MNRTGNNISISMLVAILIVVVLLAVGQVLFKYASRSLDFTRPATFLSLTLLLALAIYGIATACWLLVLSKVPLNMAFPFYGLVFLLVPIFSWVAFKERLDAATLIGSIVIALGVAITALGHRV